MDHEMLLHIIQSSRAGTSPSDCLISYPGHSLQGTSFSSAEMQLVFSTSGLTERKMYPVKILKKQRIFLSKSEERKFREDIKGAYVNDCVFQKWTESWISKKVSGDGEIKANILGGEFELKSRYYILFRTNAPPEKNEFLLSSDYGLNSTATVFTRISLALNNPGMLICH